MAEKMGKNKMGVKLEIIALPTLDVIKKKTFFPSWETCASGL